MSKFSAAWLALREPVDGRARAPAVLRAVRRWAAQRHGGGRTLRIVDLGAGSGSNLRLLAPRLPQPQTWMLIDNDEALLAAALDRQRPNPVSILRPICRVPVTANVRDLAAPGALAPILRRRADLITASALFDLVSAAWCRRLVTAIARPGVALYAALICDGRLQFSPEDPLDGTVRALVRRHQRRDKGFGAALGPIAATVLAGLAAARGATVLRRRSDWRLGYEHSAMLLALLEGWAGAARETDPKLSGAIDAWEARRQGQILAGSLQVVVGHTDLLATWRR